MQMMVVLLYHCGVSRDRADAIVKQGGIRCRRNHAGLWLPGWYLVQVVTTLSGVSRVWHHRILGSKSTAWSAIGVSRDDLLILSPVVVDRHVDRGIVATIRVELETAEWAGGVIALPCLLMTVLAVLTGGMADSDGLHLSRSGGLLSLGRACKCQCSRDCKAGC